MARGKGKAEVGFPGLNVQGGIVYDEWDRRLKSRKLKMEQYREMVDDATVSALLTAFDALMRSTDKHINPADSSPAAVEWADFVTECFDNMRGSWGDLHSEINTELAYGFSVFEIVYTARDDGKVGWLDWSPRSQDTVQEWVYDTDGRDITAFVQMAPPKYQRVTVPLDRCIHFKTRRRNENPEGASILRAAYDSYYNLKHIKRIEAIGIQRELVGVPYMRLPSSVIENATMVQSYIDAAVSLSRDEQAVVIMPSDTDENGNDLYTFQLANTGGQRAIDTDPVIARYERMILRSSLADFLTLGDGGGGSYALGVSRADLFENNVQAILDSQADTINDQAIRVLCEINSCPPDLIPTLEFDRVPSGRAMAFAETFAKIAPTGAVDTSSEEVRRIVYDVLNIPYPEDGEQTDTTEQVDDPEQPETEATPEADQPATEQADVQQFTEPLTDSLMARARQAWKDAVGDQFADMFDADVA